MSEANREEIIRNLTAIAKHINDRHNNSNLPPVAMGWCEKAILALTNLKPIDDVDLANFIISETGMDAPESDRLAQKIVRFFGKVDNLRPLEEKEVEKIIKNELNKQGLVIVAINGGDESRPNFLAKAICSHFSKPQINQELLETLKSVLENYYVLLKRDGMNPEYISGYPEAEEVVSKYRNQLDALNKDLTKEDRK